MKTKTNLNLKFTNKIIVQKEKNNFNVIYNYPENKKLDYQEREHYFNLRSLYRRLNKLNKNKTIVNKDKINEEENKKNNDKKFNNFNKKYNYKYDNTNLILNCKKPIDLFKGKISSENKNKIKKQKKFKEIKNNPSFKNYEIKKNINKTIKKEDKEKNIKFRGNLPIIKDLNNDEYTEIFKKEILEFIANNNQFLEEENFEKLIDLISNNNKNIDKDLIIKEVSNLIEELIENEEDNE